MNPVAAVAIGAFAGAILNFSLNRYFLFKSSNHLRVEIIKYGLVSAVSLGFNSGGMWLMTGYWSLNYILAKTIIALLVAILWNYPLHRYWVFCDNQKGDSSISKAE